MAHCRACAEEARFLAEMSGAFEQIGAARHPLPEVFEAHLVRTCASSLPFAENRWVDARFLRRAVAAAAVLLLAFGAVVAMMAPPATVASRSFSTQLLSLDETADAIASAFGVGIVISPDARKASFGRTASLALDAVDASAAVKAMALAFDLSSSNWGDRYVLEDRTVALVRSLGDVQRSPVKIDLSFALAPDELPLMDNIANSLVAVEDAALTTAVAKSAKLPFIKDDSDVTIAMRPDETFEVRRSLPWLYIDPETGLLEYMGISDYDNRRFEAIRDFLRGLDASESSMNFVPDRPPDVLLSPIGLSGCSTIGELAQLISSATGVSVVMGSGVDPRLPIPVDAINAASAADALDAACLGRSFYFALDGDVVVIDDLVRLQRYLSIAVIKVPEGTSPAQFDVMMKAKWNRYFPQDSRLGAMTAVFRNFILVRHHQFPLMKISNSPLSR
ncbi:MAG: hypothetical protein Kow00107_00040 [Planctomycetota bacterium]